MIVEEVSMFLTPSSKFPIARFTTGVSIDKNKNTEAKIQGGSNI
jgi:hypothetical protein